MSKPSPARYRTTNWSSYNASLRKRGSLLIWVDKDMTWRAPRDGRTGRPAVFSDAAIQFCLSIKILFKLPLRQTAGMVARSADNNHSARGGALFHPDGERRRRRVSPVPRARAVEIGLAVGTAAVVTLQISAMAIISVTCPRVSRSKIVVSVKL